MIIYNPIHAEQYFRPRLGKPGIMPRATIQSIDARIADGKDILRRRSIAKTAVSVAKTKTHRKPQEFDHDGYRSFWRTWGAEIEAMSEDNAIKLEEAAKAHFSGVGDLKAWREFMHALFEHKRAQETSITVLYSNPHVWGTGLNNGW